MRQRGFSLIEVMMASVLFLVALSGVITAFHTSQGMFGHYEKETTATHVAESLMEDLMLRQRGDAQLVPGTYSGTYDDFASVSATGRYTATWVVVADVPIQGLKTVTLSVTWTEDTVHRRVLLKSVRE
ncbi:MAG TPA: prepilin-type N-terminal cleavage/methylation domain-containing protein [Myxococcota bacterium]|jgi:prepilin-type N-terminal cleavage/methylation domain-containing protein